VGGRFRLTIKPCEFANAAWASAWVDHRSFILGQARDEGDQAGGGPIHLIGREGGALGESIPLVSVLGMTTRGIEKFSPNEVHPAGPNLISTAVGMIELLVLGSFL
jgi:hypothetical protein